MPINIEDVKIDEHTTGERWSEQNIAELAKIIAVIAMGQAVHAIEILKGLAVAEPKVKRHSIIVNAQKLLQVKGGTPDELKASRWHRDGWILEIISWIAAHKKHSTSLIKLPHLTPTDKGLDGLILKLHKLPQEVEFAIICEDKCSENPRDIFRDKVLSKFQDYHSGGRDAELLAEASALVQGIVEDGSDATVIAEKIFGRDTIHYRAALAVETERDSEKGRIKLFKGYERIDDITKNQRIGASYVVDGDLRDYFDKLANKSIGHLKQLEGDE